MASSAEDTPLLSEQQSTEKEYPYGELFTSLDADHDPDHVLDDPPTPRVRRVKQQLMNASSQAGHGHPAHEHMQSPALLIRLRQSIDHGFHMFWMAIWYNLLKAPAKASSSKVSPSVRRTAKSRHRIVGAVFVIAVLTMLAMTSVSPTLLLFMNEAGYTSPTHIAPYVTAAALSTAVPIFSNVVLTSLASRIGPGRALAFGSAVSAFGMLLIVVTRGSLLFFMLGYSLYTSSNSFRVLRVSLLSKVVAPEERTTILAGHALMTPLGGLVGPIIWVASQTFRNHLYIFSGALIIDRFTVNYLITILAFVFICIISTIYLRRIIPYPNKKDLDKEVPSNDAKSDIASDNDDTGADNNEHHLHPTVIRFSDGHEITVNLQHYRNTVFCFFCAIMLGVNMSAGIYMTAFQPVLVNVFHTSDASLGLIFELIAVFAILPPLLVAVLSRMLMDRQILIVGLMIKLIGMSLFLPIFGAVREWQVIVGFLLIIKASIFFSTASMSLFTKLLGPMTTSTLLGFLASVSSIGPALAQVVLSSRIVIWFGSIWFIVFALPAVASLIAILWPSHWRHLDPSCELVNLVTHEAELQQSEDA